MNKLTNILLGAILAIGLSVLIVSLQLEVKPQINVEPVLGSENEFYDGVSATVVSVSITATGTTQVLAASSGRQYARLQNIGEYMVSCQLDDATSTLAVGKGIILFASSSVNSIYEITPDNLYKGAVRCIAETSTNTVSVVEK